MTRITHRDSVEDMIRKGRDLERLVLARAVRWVRALLSIVQHLTSRGIVLNGQLSIVRVLKHRVWLKVDRVCIGLCEVSCSRQTLVMSVIETDFMHHWQSLHSPNMHHMTQVLQNG